MLILKNINVSCRQKNRWPRDSSAILQQLGLEFCSEKQVTSSINRNKFFDVAIEKSPIHEVAIILIFETFEKKYNIWIETCFWLFKSSSPLMFVQNYTWQWWLPGNYTMWWHSFWKRIFLRSILILIQLHLIRCSWNIETAIHS